MSTLLSSYGGFGASRAGTIPDIFRAVAPALNYMLTRGSLSETEEQSQKSEARESISSSQGRRGRDAKEGAMRGGYSRAVAGKAADQENQQSGQAYRQATMTIDRDFNARRDQVGMEAAGAAAATETAAAGIKERRRAEAEARNWYELMEMQERSRARRSAVMSLVGGVAGAAVGVGAAGIMNSVLGDISSPPWQTTLGPTSAVLTGGDPDADPEGQVMNEVASGVLTDGQLQQTMMPSFWTQIMRMQDLQWRRNMFPNMMMNGFQAGSSIAAPFGY